MILHTFEVQAVSRTTRLMHSRPSIPRIPITEADPAGGQTAASWQARNTRLDPELRVLGGPG